MKTTSIMILAATFATLGITLPASASSDECGYVDRSQWMSVEEVRAKATEMGFDVRKVEVDDGCYEVYAIDSKGQRIEAYLHPVSGEVMKQEIDD